MTKSTPANTHKKELYQKIETILLAEKIKLEKELGKFTKKNPRVADDFDAQFPEYGDDLDENAKEVEEYTVNKPLEESLENTYRDTKKALARIKSGTYGVCKYCDQPIEEKRLLARPTSASCVSCKKTLTDEV